MAKETAPKAAAPAESTKKAESAKPAAPKKQSKSNKKKVSAYNAFMKEQIQVLKKEKPDISHQERFKLVAQRWKTAPQNPKKETA